MTASADLASVLCTHAKRYPLMQAQDIVKLVYQSVMGGGHLIRDPEKSLGWIREEAKDCLQDTAPVLCGTADCLLEDIGDGMARLSLRALASFGISCEEANKAFVTSSEIHRGSLEELKTKLDMARSCIDDAIKSGGLGFTKADFDAFVDSYEEAGYPMMRHSQVFHDAYKPAYRVVCLSETKGFQGFKNGS